MLAELRTDLDEFDETERRFLMACGYQMSAKIFQASLATIPGLSATPTPAAWAFAPQLEELRSTAEKDRSVLLGNLKAGSRVAFNPD